MIDTISVAAHAGNLPRAKANPIGGGISRVARAARAAGLMFLLGGGLFAAVGTTGGAQSPTPSSATMKLSEIRMRDVCILPDPASKMYYMVGPSFRAGVRAYVSKDLKTWTGPQIIFTTPPGIWGDIQPVGIWAPELHCYKAPLPSPRPRGDTADTTSGQKGETSVPPPAGGYRGAAGKYYLFLTFDTRNRFPEQWRNWLPRVTRGSAVLVGDSPNGPFKPFLNHSTPPPDMMTLDGTLWVEEGKPYMVFAHEWVQITNGTMEAIALKDDLSEAAGEPFVLFHGSEAPWSRTGKQYGNNVTDGPSLYKSKSGKLMMIWASGGAKGYTEGLAISLSGKLAGPWTQQAAPLFEDNGGHGMLFTTFEGQLMMVLHAPNTREARPRIFELEDTGETLKVVKEFTGKE